MDNVLIIVLTSAPQSHFGRAASPSLMASCRGWSHPLHVLAVQCLLQMSPITQPLVCYIDATLTDTRWCIHSTSIALHDRNTPNSNLADIYTKKAARLITKIICEELHFHPLCKEWTRALYVLLAVHCPLLMSPITPQVWHIHNAMPVPRSIWPTDCKVATNHVFLKSHLSKFLINANFDFVMKYIFKPTFNNHFVDLLSVWKYY